MDGFLLVHMDLHQIGFRMELVHGLPVIVIRPKNIQVGCKSINRLPDYFFLALFFYLGHSDCLWVLCVRVCSCVFVGL